MTATSGGMRDCSAGNRDSEGSEGAEVKGGTVYRIMRCTIRPRGPRAAPRPHEALVLRQRRVVLDGVFNHTGRNHFAFKDCRQNGLSSVFSGWYRLREGTNHNGDPFQYEAWEGHDGLPVLNHDSAGVRTHLFDVARFWLGDVGIDGWRLDVAHEIDNDFWRDFAKVCKGEYRLACGVPGRRDGCTAPGAIARCCLWPAA